MGKRRAACCCDTVNMVGVSVPKESIPTTASEEVVLTAVSQNETVSSDQHDFNDLPHNIISKSRRERRAAENPRQYRGNNQAMQR